MNFIEFFSDSYDLGTTQKGKKKSEKETETKNGHIMVWFSLV